MVFVVSRLDYNQGVGEPISVFSNEMNAYTFCLNSFLEDMYEREIDILVSNRLQSWIDKTAAQYERDDLDINSAEFYDERYRLKAEYTIQTKSELSLAQFKDTYIWKDFSDYYSVTEVLLED